MREWHGCSGTRLYQIWENMKKRCKNKNNHHYKNYGGRGITVCQEWDNSFCAFRLWALSSGYNDDLTIDRINVNGNYEPSNCRWITSMEQCKNLRKNVRLTYNGKTQIISDWARELNIESSTIGYRHRRGWSDEECLFGKKIHKDKKNSVYLTYQGETLNMYQWAKKLNVKYKNIMIRHQRGWPDEECLFGRR